MANRLRLHRTGCGVFAADQSAYGFVPQLPHLKVKLDQSDFASKLGERTFGIGIAIEIIKHVECPIGFLSNVGRRLSSSGIAIVITPNINFLSARLKFVIAGKIRTMDEHGKPTHISPIFFGGIFFHLAACVCDSNCFPMSMAFSSAAGQPRVPCAWSSACFLDNPSSETIIFVLGAAS